MIKRNYVQRACGARPVLSACAHAQFNTVDQYPIFKVKSSSGNVGDDSSCDTGGYNYRGNPLDNANVQSSSKSYTVVRRIKSQSMY